MQLSWKYKTLIEAVPLIDFDDMRTKQRREKFHTSRGLIPPTQRCARLLEFGFSTEEIDNAEAQAAIQRRSLLLSVQMIKYDHLTEFFDGIGHFWKCLKAKIRLTRKQDFGTDLDYTSFPLTITKKSCLVQKTNSVAGSDSTHDTILSC